MMPFREIEIKFIGNAEQMAALSRDRLFGHRPDEQHRQITCYSDYRGRRHGIWQDFILDSMNACLRTRRMDSSSVMVTTFKAEDGTLSLFDELDGAVMMSRREYDFPTKGYSPDIRALRRAAAREMAERRDESSRKPFAITPLQEYFAPLRGPRHLRIPASLCYHRHDGTVKYDGSNIAFCHDNDGKIRTTDFREESFLEFELELIPEGSESKDGFIFQAQRIQREYGMAIHCMSKARRTMNVVRKNIIRNPDGSVGIVPPIFASSIYGGNRQAFTKNQEILEFLTTGNHPHKPIIDFGSTRRLNGGIKVPA